MYACTGRTEDSGLCAHTLYTCIHMRIEGRVSFSRPGAGSHQCITLSSVRKLLRVLGVGACKDVGMLSVQHMAVQREGRGWATFSLTCTCMQCFRALTICTCMRVLICGYVHFQNVYTCTCTMCLRYAEDEHDGDRWWNSHVLSRVDGDVHVERYP